MVNTFLPYPDFKASAKVLDRSRLGKQRLEAYMILCILEDYELLARFLDFPYKGGKVGNYLHELRRRYLSLSFFYVRETDGKLSRWPKHKKSSNMEQTSLPSGKVIKLGYGLHPAVRSWFSYTEALKLYITEMIDEWVARGYRNNMMRYNIDVSTVSMPPWLGNDDFHRSHRSALKFKMPEHYGHLFPDPAVIDYIWPVE